MRVRWACSKCGARGTARLETRVVFHHCRRPVQPRRRFTVPDLEGITADELRAELWEDFAGGTGEGRWQ